jgi:hypothetical protein
VWGRRDKNGGEEGEKIIKKKERKGIVQESGIKASAPKE